MRNKFLYALSAILSSVIAVQSCSSEESLDYKRYYISGKRIYEKHCRNCHGTEGQGLGELYPPLTDSAYLSLNRLKLACIIRNGQDGEITINSTVYDSPMPGNPDLPDIDVAQVIVYITNSFGNSQGFYDASRVPADLENCR